MQYFTPIHEPNQQILIVTCINRNWIVCVCVNSCRKSLVRMAVGMDWSKPDFLYNSLKNIPNIKIGWYFLLHR